MKTAIEFHPQRQWKKRRRNRNMQQRMTRKRWYQRNKSKLRTKRKQRYKQLSKNPTWKKWQKKLRHEKVKRRMIASASVPWIFGIEVGEDRVWVGRLESLDVDTEVVWATSTQSGREVCVPLGIFLQRACFLDPTHELEFWTILESVYGEVNPGEIEAPSPGQDPLPQARPGPMPGPG